MWPYVIHMFGSRVTFPLSNLKAFEITFICVPIDATYETYAKSLSQYFPPIKSRDIFVQNGSGCLLKSFKMPKDLLICTTKI